MKSIKLITSIDELNNGIKHLNLEQEKFSKIRALNEADLKSLKLKCEKWNSEAQNLFAHHFYDPDNFLLGEFRTINNPLYGIRFGGMPEHLDQKTAFFKRSLQDRGEFLQKLNTLIPELDLVVGNEPLINIQEVDIDDVFYLILFKLNRLKSEEFYSVKYILTGNGIDLIRKDELSELMFELSEKYYIKTSDDDKAQITIKGEMHLKKMQKLKNKTKTTNSNKSSIDDVLFELNKLGLGQQILFDELTELKSLKAKLNHKNWKQLVKGKLLEMTLSKVISRETAQFIFDRVLPEENLTHLLR